jgi:hypothetical protein
MTLAPLRVLRIYINGNSQQLRYIRLETSNVRTILYGEWANLSGQLEAIT